MKEKIIIYQLLPRLFSNSNDNQVIGGSIEQNGCGKFNDLTDHVLSKLQAFGVTHIWLTGIIRHATLSHYPQFGLPASHPDIVKGKAGSPYAINDYYDVDPDLAVDVPSRMTECENLIQRIHDQGLKVIIDFVPNHVARDYHSRHLPKGTENLGENDCTTQAFSPSNNFYYLPGEKFTIRGLTSTVPTPFLEFPAKATGNDVFRSDPDVHDWYETAKLNYGVDYQHNQKHFTPLPNTWARMTQILLFWAEKGIDGFRCDMAGMVPVEFWHYAISQIKGEYPDMLFIAELYEPDKYSTYLEAGYFDFLYDKVGLYDSLKAIINGSSTQLITKVWQSSDGHDNRMLRFLENHDEQRIASKFFANDPWMAIPAMVITTLLNQGPVLIYAGQEVGEPATGAQGFSGDDGRTSIFDYSCIPELQKWYHAGSCDGSLLSEDQLRLRACYEEIIHTATRNRAFFNGYLYDLMWVNEDIPYRDRIYAFLRYAGEESEKAFLITVCFNRDIRETMIKIPEHALNTIGFGAKQRVIVEQINHGHGAAQTLLTSQLIGVGVPVTFNNAGYSILTIS